MSQDELSRIWAWRYKALHADVAGLKAEMLWVRLRLAPNTTSPTPSSPASWPTPTASPSKTPSPSWPKRLFRLGFAKLTGEALSAALMWLGTRFLTWALYAILGLPALAWLARWLRLFGFG
jgi:hypothetical protein